MHARAKLVASVRYSVTTEWLKLTDKLTPWERTQILTSLIQDEAKYGVRFERHGNYETKGDEES